MPVDLTPGRSIIEAYMQGVQLRKQQESQKADEAYRQQALDQADKQFQQRMKQSEKNLKLREEQFKLENKLKIAEARRQMEQAVTAGTRQPTSIDAPYHEEAIRALPLRGSPTMEQDYQRAFDLENKGTVAKLLFPEYLQAEGFPEEEQVQTYGQALSQLISEKRLENQLLGERTQITEEVKLPFELEKIAVQSKIAMDKYIQQQAGRESLQRSLIDARHANAKELENLRTENDKILKEIPSANYQATPEQYQAITDNILLGTATYDPKNPVIRAAWSLRPDPSWKAPDKASIRKIKDVASFTVYFNIAEDVTKLLTTVPAARLPQMMHGALPSEFKNKMLTAASYAAPIARTFFQERGAMSDKDVQRAMGLIVNPQMTVSDAIWSLNVLKNTFHKLIKAELGGMPSSQIDWTLRQFFEPNAIQATGYGSSESPQTDLVILDHLTGKTIPDTPENRKAHGIPLEAK